MKHLPPGKLYIHKLPEGILKFINPQELIHGLKEIFIEEIYRQTLNESPYIIDCGANIGLSVLYLKRNHPHATILAFEPDERNFELLTQNVASFNLKDIELRKQAVWTHNTVLSFSNNGTMGSHLEPSRERSNQASSTLVEAVRLKDLLNRKVDFLKIDIEGAEYSVMVDIADRLRLVSNLFIEYHGKFEQNHELNQILSIVSENGFAYYIKEATPVYKTPFYRSYQENLYDVQLNIFCFRI